MSYPVLYPDENPSVKRHSSIDQFKGFLSVWKHGGWAPIVFDQLDGINCETINTHPVVISWGDDVGFVFPETHCTYASDHFVYFDEQGIEQKILPECFGQGGEFYDVFVKKFSFVNFDDDSIGVHNKPQLRVGLSYVIADETLPPAE